VFLFYFLCQFLTTRALFLILLSCSKFSLQLNVFINKVLFEYMPTCLCYLCWFWALLIYLSGHDQDQVTLKA
jgi:hypothetical protein